ncbi:hypothetical protein E3J48_05715 [Candidatus Aerophobetes bacterium]|uniref:RACo linker region domain-containing protein n=1 Tax=Aerophobetes bacterium TaxID=2030807 RepID=A0A523W2S4_UNCAE|nr:MAG: hypothetical protein E3J48_05715 [Candidatus Aerophobetes bacterium]
MEGKIFIDRDAQRFRALYAPVKERAAFTYDPLIQKTQLNLSPPSLHDNLSDHVRLYREIRRKKKIDNVQTGLKVIRTLPSILREADWRVTVTLGKRGGITSAFMISEGLSVPETQQ